MSLTATTPAGTAPSPRREPRDPSATRSRLPLAGIVAGIVFAVGFVSFLMVPGLGGTSSTRSFTDFYDSSGKRGAATVLGFGLMIGCWLMIWTFGELRDRLGHAPGTTAAFHLGVGGLVAVMVGMAVDLGPSGVQATGDNHEFVGIPVAHAFAQAAAGIVIMGLFTCAAAVLLYGLAMRRTGQLPRWLGTVSVVMAVLLIGSFFGAPGFLLPIWAILVGVTARRPATR